MGRIKKTIYSLSTGLLFFAIQANAVQKTYQLSGIVEKISKRKLVLQDHDNIYEFSLLPNITHIDKDIGKQEDVKVGDIITVIYTLEAHEIIFNKAGNSQAGQVNSKKKNIIIDDRAFYPAKKEESNISNRRG